MGRSVQGLHRRSSLGVDQSKCIAIARNVTSDYEKTCFILKGTPLPANTQFKDRLVGDIKAVCRSFGSEDHLRGTPSLTSPHGQPMVARKTQRRSPQGQLFSLLDSTTPQFHPKHSVTPTSAFAQRTADQTQSYQEDGRGPGGNNTSCENGQTVTDLTESSMAMPIQVSAASKQAI